MVATRISHELTLVADGKHWSVTSSDDLAMWKSTAQSIASRMAHATEGRMRLVITCEEEMTFAEVTKDGVSTVWEVGEGWPPNCVQGDSTPATTNALVSAFGLLAKIIKRVEYDNSTMTTHKEN